MKICMLAEFLPPAFGGAACQALRLAGELRRMGLEVFFLGRRERGFRHLDSTLDGFSVIRVGVGSPPAGKWAKIRALLGSIAILTLQRRRYEILHIHGPYYLTLAVGLFARRVLRKKLVLKLTLTDFDTPSGVKAGKYGWFAWYCYCQADAYACMSSALYEECLQHGLPKEKLFRTPNGVEASHFQPVRTNLERVNVLKHLGLPAGYRYAVFIGTIEKRKGVDLLVEIAAAVCSRHNDVRFLLIGPDGRRPVERHIPQCYVNAIQSRIQILGLEDRILLLGHQTNTWDYLRAATLFVFTSRAEGFGTVVIEAMASGLPCVVLNLPGVTSDIISNGDDGIVIEGEDVPAFATEIGRILTEETWARELGNAARRAALERFDMPVVARGYLELYERSLANSKGGTLVSRSQPLS